MSNQKPPAPPPRPDTSERTPLIKEGGLIPTKKQ